MKKYGPKRNQNRNIEPAEIVDKTEQKVEIKTNKRVRLLSGAYKAAIKKHEDAKKRANKNKDEFLG